MRVNYNLNAQVDHVHFCVSMIRKMKERKKHTCTHIVAVVVAIVINLKFSGCGEKENHDCASDGHASVKHCCDDRQHHGRDHLQRYMTSLKG